MNRDFTLPFDTERAECRIRRIPQRFFYYDEMRPSAERWDAASKVHAACNACAVREQCLKYAIDTHQEGGVWGGKTDSERKQIRRARYRLQVARQDGRIFQ